MLSFICLLAWMISRCFSSKHPLVLLVLNLTACEFAKQNILIKLPVVTGCGGVSLHLISMTNVEERMFMSFNSVYFVSLID